MIDSLFKPVGTEDAGIVRELLIDFYTSSGKRKPEQIVIFRDGVSESQFNQVLNIELDQIIEACNFLDEQWCPKFTLIIAQKNHHTKFFQPGQPDNVSPGTVVDNAICHPRNYDFYMCAHAGMIGTTRPTHYHVLYDEIGFGTDDLQELVHSLSYVYQRSTTAISVGLLRNKKEDDAGSLSSESRIDKMIQEESTVKSLFKKCDKLAIQNQVLMDFFCELHPDKMEALKQRLEYTTVDSSNSQIRQESICSGDDYETVGNEEHVEDLT